MAQENKALRSGQVDFQKKGQKEVVSFVNKRKKGQKEVVSFVNKRKKGQKEVVSFVNKRKKGQTEVSAEGVFYCLVLEEFGET